MKPMRCCHCGRRLAALSHPSGAVGPVCAVKLGLPRELKPQPPERSKPAKRVRIRFVDCRENRRDPHTLDWIREAATC